MYSAVILIHQRSAQKKALQQFFMQFLLWRPLFAYSQRILGTEISNDYKYIYPPWLTTLLRIVSLPEVKHPGNHRTGNIRITIKLRHTVIVNQAALGLATWCLSAFFLFLLGKSRQSFLSTFQVALRFASAMAQD
jgi:hypothetical protein